MDKRIMPKELVPDDLVGVSPFRGPVGEIWKLREKYKESFSGPDYYNNFCMLRTPEQDIMANEDDKKREP